MTVSRTASSLFAINPVLRSLLDFLFPFLNDAKSIYFKGNFKLKFDFVNEVLILNVS